MANIYKVNYTYLIFFWCLVSHFAYAQQPFTKDYSPESYRGAGQNWDVTQGKSGMIYVANNDGMLQYDGLQWKLFTLPKKNFVYSLALAEDGKIFVGGVDELGYFKRNSQGTWVFTSLRARLVPKVKQIKTILKTKVVGNKVVFINSTQTFVYENQQFTALKAGRYSTFILEDRLYIKRKGKLWVYEQGKLQASDLIKGFDISKLNFIIPWKNKQWMMIDSERQIWIYNAQAPPTQRIKLARWQHRRLLGKYENFVKAMHLPNQQTALCTFDRLFILDKDGKLVHTTNINNKDINNNINGLHYDHQGNLWLAMNYGIKTVMLNSPLTHRSSKDGFRGVIYSLGNQGDYTYIGTNYGVYYYTKQSPQIKRMKGVYNDCWNFYNYDGSTFLANTSGVFQITDSTAKWLTRYRYVHSLAKLKAKNHFVVGTYSIGIWLLKKEKDGWVSHKIKGFDKETRFMKEGAQGHLWVTHYNEGVYKLKLNPQRDSVVKQTFYGTKQGLPSTQNTRVYRLNNGQLVFTTVKGFYAYNASTDRFEPIKAFNQALGDKYCVYTFQEDTQGNLYCWLGQGAPYNREVAGVLKKQANGTFKLVTNLFNNIEVATNGLRVDVDAPVMISPSQNKVLIGNLSKLLTYDVTKSANIKQNYQVIIRNFRAGDSSVFRYGSQAQNIVLPYAMHNIDIHYAAMTYENIHKTRYSYWLKGFDTKWSAWRTQPESNFTNLPEGKYTFMVKARNVYGKESQINSFSFQILPPWYRTWWAYTVYILVSIGVIGLIAWLNSRRLIRQKVVLEQIVRERTEEVLAQNEELKQNQDEILAQRGYIEDQNQHLLQKNTMIQQSIKSALTIQQAFLPSETRAKGFLPKSFIVYQPKDIVSGDFYWIEKVGNKTIVIAADCTGHGVPGAFMSLIGYNLFNKIILQQGYHNPVDILDQLHEQIAIALKQPESNNINGMDLIILIMEDASQKATQLTFAGARRPLYYLLPDQKETLHVVKGTRKSIGGLQNKRVSFQLHELTLPQNSMLYVGSDGLADQNNPERKKFGAKRLEDLLQQIAWLPLEEQKAAIEQELTKHMQGAAQRDDILWMGIQT